MTQTALYELLDITTLQKIQSDLNAAYKTAERKEQKKGVADEIYFVAKAIAQKEASVSKYKGYTLQELKELVDDMYLNTDSNNICHSDSESKLKKLGILNDEGCFIRPIPDNEQEKQVLEQLRIHINDLD